MNKSLSKLVEARGDSLSRGASLGSGIAGVLAGSLIAGFPADE
jgi:hypothetical protein